MSEENVPVIIGVADAIVSETNYQEFNSLDVNGKIETLLEIAMDKILDLTATTRSKLFPLITDFISFGASVYDDKHFYDTLRKADFLGLTGIRAHTVDLGGASVAASLHRAYEIVRTNFDAVVLIAGAEIPRAGYGGAKDYERINEGIFHPSHEKPYKPTAIAYYALLARRLMFDHLITNSQLEEITEYFRELSIDEPRAFNYQKPIAPKNKKRYLCTPYTSAMVAIANDHAFATLVVSEKKYQELKKQGTLTSPNDPVYIIGAGEANHTEYFSHKKNLMSPSSISGRRALQTAELQPHQIDYAWIYDCFTAMIPMQAANYFGIKPNQAASSLTKGVIEVPKPNGSYKKIPINQGGGILNYNAAIAISGATGLIDILSQYGLAANPIKNILKEKPKNSLLGGNGGVDSVNSVVILSNTRPTSPLGITNVKNTLSLNNPVASENMSGTILASTTIFFHPGHRKLAPFVLALTKLENGHFTLTNLFDHNRKKLLNDDSIVFDQTEVKLEYIDNVLQAVLV